VSAQRLIAIAPRIGPPLKVHDLYWAAGFLEGEGWFGWLSQKKGKPAITCPQVQREPLDRLVRIFGANVYLRKGQRRIGKYEINGSMWCWQTSGRKAAAIMMTLYCLMSPKRQKQIHSTLEKWKANPYSGSRRAYGYGVVPDNLRARKRRVI
jgi:hypothetical protein